MALNMPALPGQKALDKLQQRKNTERWVANHKQEIRQTWARVTGGSKVPDAVLERMARSDPKALERLTQIYQADVYRQVYESYYGEKKPFKYKKGADRNNTRNALAFYANLARKYETPEELDSYLTARTKVDELTGTAESKRMVNLFGYGNLVKAYEGRQGYTQLLDQATFFGQLDPIMRQNLGREATLADVADISKRFASASAYGTYLGAAPGTESFMKEIKDYGLETYGAGNINQEALQKELAITGGLKSNAGDLQRRILEARARRKNAFTAGKSQAAGSFTEGGKYKLNLF